MDRRIIVLLAILVACCAKDNDRPAVEGARVNAVPATRIGFWGLTAFFPQGPNGHPWAFLVDADYKTCMENDLPPGVDCAKEDDYPPHRPWIAFDNAKVRDGDNAKVRDGSCLSATTTSLELFKGEFYTAYSLAGQEVEIELEGPITKSQLDKLVSYEEIQQTSTFFQAKENLSSMDLATAKLSARAEVIPGTDRNKTFELNAIEAPLNENGSREFFFCYEDNSGNKKYLEGASGQRVNVEILGEETVLSSVASEIVKIKIGNETCVFDRDDPNESMRIWILNVVEESKPNSHWQAFRWFYHLVKDQNKEHYYPCDPKVTSAGGRRCPELQMVQ